MKNLGALELQLFIIPLLSRALLVDQVEVISISRSGALVLADSWDI